MMATEAPDFEELFTEEFLAEIERRKEKTDIEPTEWRAGGRASKAWPNKEDSSWWLTSGPKMVADWYAWWQQAKAEGWALWYTPTGVPAVELAVNAVLGGKMFKGYIDAIMVDPDGDVVVIDWKTGREPVAPVQLGMYACAIEKTIGVRPSHGSHYMARKGDLGHVYDLSVYTEQVVGQWLSRAALIEAQGLYIPHPSSLCSACGVRDYCSVMSENPEKVASVPNF